MQQHGAVAEQARAFETFVAAVAPTAGVRPCATPEASDVHVRTGRSGDARMAFVLWREGEPLSMTFHDAPSDARMHELVQGRDVEARAGVDGVVTVDLPPSDWGLAVLTVDAGA